MDRHRYDAGLDPDSTFHLDTDPDPDSDPTQNFSHVGKTQQCHSTLGVIILNNLDIKF
jgi:hypothetical protein